MGHRNTSRTFFPIGSPQVATAERFFDRGSSLSNTFLPFFDRNGGSLSTTVLRQDDAGGLHAPRSKRREGEKSRVDIAVRCSRFTDIDGD